MSFSLLVKNAKQLVVVSDKSSNTRSKYGDIRGVVPMNTITIIEDGSMLVDESGRIAWVGKTADLPQSSLDTLNILDATNKTIIPGFVDGHTHPVWSGDRCHEFSMKLQGASYMDIHQIGGGIHFTVQHVRESSEEELLCSLMKRLDRMLCNGTVVIEAKSGYGLDTETELKMLRVLHRANQMHPIEIVSNFCGAHSIPKGMTGAEAVDDIVNRQIPAVKHEMESGNISPTLIDVFCEKGVFDIDQTREILRAGAEIGLQANFHGDELFPMKAAELSSEMDAVAISHLECISEKGIQSLASSRTIAVLLPTTAYVLRIEPPPARKMIDSGVSVALGSDFNPNAHCLSMPFVMNLACVTMKMTMEEALMAGTLNSAVSLGRESTNGTLECGKWADFVVLDAPKWEHVIYQLVDPPIESVYIHGKKCFPF